MNSTLKHAFSAPLAIATFSIGLALVAFLAITEPAKTEPNLMPPETQNAEIREVATENPLVESSKSRGPKVTQSAIVHFPRQGAVKVESIEEVGKFPQMVFTDQNDQRVLLRSKIADEDKLLKPTDDTTFRQFFLRFREIHSAALPSPLIMAIAVSPGGSDDGFWMVLYGEINGKLSQLTRKPVVNAIQGGYYVGFLNRKFGFGLVSWSFIWDFDQSEAHYGEHHYSTDIYSLHNGKFRKSTSFFTKRKYDLDGMPSSVPLRELGIRAKDQRKTFPDLRNFLE